MSSRRDADAECAPSPLVTCPYSSKHRVPVKSFSQHIAECRREYCKNNPKKIKFVRCQHNGRHFVPQIEINFHERICDDGFFDQTNAEMRSEPVPIVIDDRSPTSTPELDETSSSSESEEEQEEKLEAEQEERRRTEQ